MNAGATVKKKLRFEHHHMLGMRLDYAPIETFIDELAHSAEIGASAYCCVPDVFQCTICHDRKSHRDIVNGADYVVSDSMVMQFARALRHGVPVMKTIRGSELMLALCAQAARRGIPIALIGGRDNAVLDSIKSALMKKYPTLRIAYGYSPPFRELTSDEEKTMLDELASSGARLVFVGIGCPKQEQWMGRYKGTVHATMIGVGAAFDAIGGLYRHSPAIVHRVGLEWLFRLVREPRRLYKRYLGSAPRFVWLMLNDWTRSPQR